MAIYRYLPSKNNFLCPTYKSLRDNFFTLFNKNLNETREFTVNRILNPCTSQELNNICFFLKNLTHSENHILKIFDSVTIITIISHLVFCCGLFARTLYTILSV